MIHKLFLILSDYSIILINFRQYNEKYYNILKIIIFKKY